MSVEVDLTKEVEKEIKNLKDINEFNDDNHFENFLSILNLDREGVLSFCNEIILNEAEKEYNKKINEKQYLTTNDYIIIQVLLFHIQGLSSRKIEKIVPIKKSAICNIIKKYKNTRCLLTYKLLNQKEK